MEEFRADVAYFHLAQVGRNQLLNSNFTKIVTRDTDSNGYTHALGLEKCPLYQLLFHLKNINYGKSRDQTKDRKTPFRPKISAEISAERLSVLKLLSVCLQKGLLLAERPSFGRKEAFLPKE